MYIIFYQTLGHFLGLTVLVNVNSPYMNHWIGLRENLQETI